MEDLLTIYIFLTVGLLIDPWRDDPEVSSGDEIEPENVSFEDCCVVRFVALDTHRCVTDLDARIRTIGAGSIF